MSEQSERFHHREPGVRNAIIFGEACARINDPGYSREWWEASMGEWRFVEGLLLTDAEFRARYEIAKAQAGQDAASSRK